MFSRVLPVAATHELLVSRLGVSGVIKLRMTELDDLPETDAHFFHVNAAPCAYLAGQTYAAAGIAASESGSAPETLLYPGTARAVRIVETERFDSVNDIPQELISRIVGRPGSSSGLVAMMLERYSRIRGWSRWDAANHAVVLSRLAMVMPNSPAHSA